MTQPMSSLLLSCLRSQQSWARDRAPWWHAYLAHMRPRFNPEQHTHIHTHTHTCTLTYMHTHTNACTHMTSRSYGMDTTSLMC
jgi:hypothetical protein